ncbi:MAG: hypothetical protein NTW86_31440 [Candidatus Sumerlaeota bacterium]|nr:hypothetical protein [Candidatus Sumerlaeota bacterium]
MRMVFLAFCAVPWIAFVAAQAAEPGGNLIPNGGFEQPAAKEGGASKGPCYSIVDGQGRNGGKCLRYKKEAEPPAAEGKKENFHYDFIIPVEPQAAYAASAWFKTEGVLRPSLRIASMDWQALAAGICTDAKDWQEIRVIFRAGADKEVRLQIFGGGKTEARETAVGASYCDDVSARKATAEDLKAMTQCRITVDAATPLRAINPLFFGVNTLFWIEDDASLKDGKIARYLHDMPCRLMRFPGGEVGDNYHWKTKKLDNIKQFPSQEGPDKLDCDKFMTMCREVGAEPIFMANLESGFVHNDIDAVVKEAAEWVQYANKEKGYNVKYWEVGNETYLAGTYFPTTAREYAEAFVKFSKAMKAVDPTIQIGACGPQDAANVVPVDKLTPDELKAQRAKERGARKNDLKTAAAAKGEAKGDAWWPTVVRIAGADMDFAVYHRYSPNVFGPDANAGKPIVALKEFFRKELGREIPIAVTEWNAGKTTQAGMAPALIMAELIGDYLKAGVDMACEWPMRYTGGFNARSILDYKTNEPRPSYYVMKLYSSNMGPGSKLLPSKSSNPAIYATACQSADGAKTTIFLVNKTMLEGPMEAAVSIDGFGGKKAAAVSLSSPDLNSDKAELKDVAPVGTEGQTTFPLAPDSLTVITVEK